MTAHMAHSDVQVPVLAERRKLALGLSSVHFFITLEVYETNTLAGVPVTCTWTLAGWGLFACPQSLGWGFLTNVAHDSHCPVSLSALIYFSCGCKVLDGSLNNFFFPLPMWPILRQTMGLKCTALINKNAKEMSGAHGMSPRDRN